MLEVGTMPRSITIVLMDDLVDTCRVVFVWLFHAQAGDDVVITGVVRQKWRPLARDAKCDVNMIVVGLSIRLIGERDNDRFLTEELVKKYQPYWTHYYRQLERPFLGRNILVNSVCPNLYGLYLACPDSFPHVQVKLSLLLILIGGVSSTDPTKTPIRSQSHLLIVGDSSTGKSQLLLFASKLAMRSVMTSGLGTTR